MPLWLSFLIVLPCLPARAQTAPARPPQSFALLIAGKAGSPIFARRFDDWLKRFNLHLTAAGSGGIPASNIITLNSPTRDNILASITKLAQTIRPEDQFILIILGHGSLSDAKPALILTGPDLDAETLAKALAPIQARNQVILNFSGAAGDFLKPLAKKDRVNIAATLPEEVADPAYAEFFLRALEANRNINLLDAYNTATHETALWICRQVAAKDDSSAPGAWTVEGKQSIEIFKKLYDGPEAPITPGGMPHDGSRKLSPDSDPTKPDADVPIVVPPDIKPNSASYWVGRRVVNEHAQLEDAGQESGLSALRGEKGFDPITPSKDTPEGPLAARTILGNPKLLAPPEK